MAWLLWLAVPIGAPMLTAVVLWWRARPSPRPDADAAMAAHQAYLDALTRPARGTHRVCAPDL